MLLKSGVLTVVKPNHDANAHAEEERIFENTDEMFFHRKEVLLYFYTKTSVLAVLVKERRRKSSIFC